MREQSAPRIARRVILRAAPALTAVAILAACAGAPATSPSQPSAATGAPTQIAAGATMVSGQAVAAAAKLNLNTATDEQLRTIPGVGDRMVREFLEYRPYASIQQFRREIGKYVSADQVAAYEEYVFVPVDPNAADAETLQQLPGVDAALAAKLIAGRPYPSTDAFLATLGELISADQAASAPGYLVPS